MNQKIGSLVSHAAITATSFFMGLALTSSDALAMGAAPAAQPSPAPVSSGSAGGSAFAGAEDLILNLAVLYAQNSEYAPILTALNIHSGADLKAFLARELNGQNFGSTLAYFVSGQAMKDPNVGTWLGKLGIANVGDIQKYLNNPSTLADQDTLFELAYDYAKNNPQYASWLKALNINSAADLGKLLQPGAISGGNLQSQLLSIGAASLLGKGQAGSAVASLLPQLNLGSLQGLSFPDISQITKIAAAAK